jgi:hypothetical protein
MTLKATLELAETRLVWPQTTRGVVTLLNVGEEPAERVNQELDRAETALGVTDLSTAKATLFARPPPPGGPFHSVTIAPGEAHHDRFVLGRRVDLPGPGMYSVRAHAAWEGGSSDSIPVRVEIVAAAPRLARVVTTSGGPGGHVYCAWVNAENESGALWLSLITASPDLAFVETTRLARVPITATPVLSVPPLGPSSHRYVAWTARRSLVWAMTNAGQVVTSVVELDAADYLIATPVLEAPFVPGEAPYAEALLIHEIAGGFQLRVARLAAPSTVGPAVRCEGPMPRWAHIAYRADAGRSTTFFAPHWRSPGEPAIAVSLGAWEPGSDPAPPELQASWPGVLFAADQCLTADGTALGVMLLDVGLDAPRYALQRWKVTPEGRFEEGTLTWVGWEHASPIARAVLRVNAAHEACLLLLSSGADAGWFRWTGRGEVESLAGAIGATATPMDGFFFDWTKPAILYNDPGTGLRIFGGHGAGTPRV